MASRGPRKPADYATRAQALTLLSTGLTLSEIGKKTGFTKSGILRIEKKAKERGYDPEKDLIIYIRYVEDAPRIGRPKKCTPEVEEKVVALISKNSTTRELST
jgi:hypothetical protein